MICLSTVHLADSKRYDACREFLTVTSKYAARPCKEVRMKHIPWSGIVVAVAPLLLLAVAVVNKNCVENDVTKCVMPFIS